MKSKLVVISIISLVICATLISHTYAVFETNSSGNVSMSVGSWVIKLNDVLISTSNEQTFSVDDFTFNDSENVESGYFAPGTNGYFDLILDSTGTDVAVKYSISFDIDDVSQDNISIRLDGNDSIRIGESAYAGVVDLEDIENEEQITLRIYIDWVNDTMYDDFDTEMGIVQGSKVRIPITINVVQYLGETITEYVPSEDEEE